MIYLRESKASDYYERSQLLQSILIIKGVLDY